MLLQSRYRRAAIRTLLALAVSAAANTAIAQEFRYGGRNDYFLNVEGEKLGLSQGLFVTLHGETRYGESVNSLTGALMPANLLLAVPQPNDSVWLLLSV